MVNFNVFINTYIVCMSVCLSRDSKRIFPSTTQFVEVRKYFHNEWIDQLFS